MEASSGTLSTSPLSFNDGMSGLTHYQSSDESLQHLPPYDLCLELVELYFRYIHDTFHSILHKASFLEDVANGTASHAILLAMISLSSRLAVK